MSDTNVNPLKASSQFMSGTNVNHWLKLHRNSCLAPVRHVWHQWNISGTNVNHWLKLHRNSCLAPVRHVWHQCKSLSHIAHLNLCLTPMLRNTFDFFVWHQWNISDTVVDSVKLHLNSWLAPMRHVWHQCKPLIKGSSQFMSGTSASCLAPLKIRLKVHRNSYLAPVKHVWHHC